MTYENLSTKEKIILIFSKYGIHIFIVLFIVNLTAFESIKVLISASSCMTIQQVQSDRRCLYIYGQDVYQKGSRSNPHHGHACGSNVTAVLPRSHIMAAARYLDPNLVSTICQNTPPTPTLTPTNTPASATDTPIPTSAPTNSPIPTSTPKVSFPSPTPTPILTPTPTLKITQFGSTKPTFMPTPTPTSIPIPTPTPTSAAQNSVVLSIPTQAPTLAPSLSVSPTEAVSLPSIQESSTMISPTLTPTPSPIITPDVPTDTPIPLPSQTPQTLVASQSTLETASEVTAVLTMLSFMGIVILTIMRAKIVRSFLVRLFPNDQPIPQIGSTNSEIKENEKIA